MRNETPPCHESGVGRIRPGVSIPFDSVRSPGCYVCNWSGHLLRISHPLVAPDGVVNIVGGEPLLVTKIADDPTLPLTQARAAAAAFHVTTSF